MACTLTAIAIHVGCKDGAGDTGADSEGAARVLRETAKAVV